MKDGRSALSPETLVLLAQASTATLTTLLFKHGLRRTFLGGLRPLNRGATRFAGEAFTLRFIPAREDVDVWGVTHNPEYAQRKAVESIGAGQVLVADCRSITTAGCVGDILVARIMQRGAVALVADGAVRDSPSIARMDFPVFCRDVSATLSFAALHAADVQIPIACADVAVYPGDILVGDEEGVVCVPRSLASEIALLAIEQDRFEAFLLRKIQDGAPLAGTYPADEHTRAEYEAWRRRDDTTASSR